MGLGHSWAVALVGVQGYLVEVEADVAQGLPAFNLVGLPDTALNESRERVRTATTNSGCGLPPRRLTVNLSPAALPKTGTGFDVAVAISLLAASSQVDPESVARYVHIGELGLGGQVCPVRGVLPAVLAAVTAGHEKVVVPQANMAEASLVPGAQVTGIAHLSQAVALHRGEDIAGVVIGAGDEVGSSDADGSGADTANVKVAAAGAVPDLADVVGQMQARFALEVAAAGGHHLLMLGPPGAGKTMLAQRLPGLLPDLDDQAALEVTTIHSVAGTLPPASGLIRRPPYEDPHHSATLVALVGGGNGMPRPGAVSRAHGGVLFLDEATEFDRRALDALRQPLEQGSMLITRAHGEARFPARFQLVLAANPCPCGQATGRGMNCTCTSVTRRRYLSRLSGPLLDRIDLQVEVAPVSRAQLELAEPPESSAIVAARVTAARKAQCLRLAGTPWRCNADISGSWLRKHAPLPAIVTQDLDRALERGQLSIRGYDRVIRVAWTVADLAGHEVPDRDDVGRALVLRHRNAVLP